MYWRLSESTGGLNGWQPNLTGATVQAADAATCGQAAATGHETDNGESNLSY